MRSRHDNLLILLPTRNRPRFLRRCLTSLDEQGFSGQVLLCDGSEGTDAALVSALAARAWTFQCTRFVPKKIGYVWTELREALESTRHPYCVTLHDDDLLVIPAVEAARDYLEDHGEHVAAIGRMFYVSFSNGAPGFQSQRTYSYDAPSPCERFTAVADHHCQLFFGVVRRNAFVRAVTTIEKHLQQGWFDQFAFPMLLATFGPTRALDVLYELRQTHENQHHHRLDPYDHWPLLLASPRFSETYARFKRCIQDGSAGLIGGTHIDRALVAMIRRASGLTPEFEPGEHALRTAIAKGEGDAADTFSRAVAMMTRFPEGMAT